MQPRMSNALNKGGRPRLSADEKLRRGTLRPHREKRAAPRQKPAKKSAHQAKDYVAIAHRYVLDVLNGSITACEWVKRACQRQRRDIERARSDRSWPFVFSEEEATKACQFIEQLPHVEGRWASPLINLEPSQVFLVTLLFGWRHRDDQAKRRFTLLYLETARKSAKSTLMAAIALYHMLREQEPGASVVCGATTGQQARIVFGIMQKMIQRSKWLREQGVQSMANAILTTDGVARPINAKASTQDGLNPSCIVLDESHAQTFALHDVLKSAQGARTNPLMLCPTTAGYNLLSVGYALRTMLTKVLQQVYEADHLLGVIYTLDDGDDWRDEKVWQKANPMLGITPTVEWVRQYCLDAQQAPGTEGEFKVKVCSLWAQSASSWLSMTAWDRCADRATTFESFDGEDCWIGADLAQVDDLAAVALVFERDGCLYGFVRCYLPRAVVEERARAVPAYRSWVDDGILTMTEGDLIDLDVIETDIRRWCQQFDVNSIVFDQFGAQSLAGTLAADGLPATTEAKNARTFTPPARELESRLKVGKFRHDGNSCLKWMASNCVVTRRIDDTILPKKESAESPNKIDGMDALLLGIGALLRTPAAPANVYISRGVRTLGE